MRSLINASHLTWKRRFAKQFKYVPRRSSRNIILLYHAVGCIPGVISRSEFKKQILWLADNSLVVSVDQILQNGLESGLRVALTFDDGYSCLSRTVAPILEEVGLTATVYLNTRCVGDRQRIPSEESKGHYSGLDFLVWNEVMALYDCGWIIGSHGADHVDLTKLSDAEVHFQLSQSKADIEDRLSSSCRHFAYTWGNHNRRVRRAVERCGYKSAMAGVHGVISPSVDHYDVPRIDIRSDYELADFIALMKGDWDFLEWLQRARRFIS